MSKELEAFERINHTICSNYNRKNLKLSLSEIDCQNLGMLIDDLDIIENALQRLEQIDNAKPSKALKELKHWKETNNENGVVWIPLFAVEDIEQALLQAKKDKAEIERLKRENVILKAELDAFEKIAFKK